MYQKINGSIRWFEELAEIANKHGKPWCAELGVETGEFITVAEGWYQSY